MKLKGQDDETSFPRWKERPTTSGSGSSLLHRSAPTSSFAGTGESRRSTLLTCFPSARLCRLVLRVVAGYSADDKGACGVLQEEAVQRMLSEKLAEEPAHGRTLKKVVLLEGVVVAASSARVQVSQHALWLLHDQQINQEWKDLIARGERGRRGGIDCPADACPQATW